MKHEIVTPYVSGTGSPFCKANTSYGIWDNMLALLVSHPKNRKQFTLCNDAKSQINTTQCGILQQACHISEVVNRGIR